MPKQLTAESREALHIHLNKKITRADLEIKKLTTTYEKNEETGEITWGEPVKTPYSAVLENKIAGYRGQIENCQLSLRMAHNTGWIAEWREEHIRVAKEKIEKELTPKIEEVEKLLSDEVIPTPETQKRLDGLHLELGNLRLKVKDLTRAKVCNKKDCYGRGYIGFNISTGEYSFCTCTEKTKHYYNVNKSSD